MRRWLWPLRSFCVLRGQAGHLHRLLPVLHWLTRILGQTRLRLLTFKNDMLHGFGALSINTWLILDAFVLARRSSPLLVSLGLLAERRGSLFAASSAKQPMKLQQIKPPKTSISFLKL